MRVWCLVIGIVALPVRAQGDVSIARAAASSGNGWMPSCTATLEHARDELTRIDSRFGDARVSSDTNAAVEADDCEAAATRIVTLDSKAASSIAYSVTVVANPSIDHAEAWNRRDRVWIRARSGASGWVKIDPARELALGVLRHAVDVCLAALPAARPVSATPAPAGLSDAERAAWELERWCGILFRQSLSGAMGRTRPALARITALGEAATPILLRLARSQNPAARAAAAMGLGQVESAAGRAMLQRLMLDDTMVEAQHGCTVFAETVAKFAREALARQTMPNQDRR
jgi:hypothetical protein